jgi:hypothetical protein
MICCGIENSSLRASSIPNKLCIENMQRNDGVSKLFNFSWVFWKKNYCKFYPKLKCPWFKLHVDIVKCKRASKPTLKYCGFFCISITNDIVFLIKFSNQLKSLTYAMSNACFLLLFKWQCCTLPFHNQYTNYISYANSSRMYKEKINLGASI